MNLQGRSSIVVRFVAAATFTAVAMVGCSNDGGGIRNPVGPTSPVAQQGGPDLGVASPSVSDSSPAAGAPFTLTVAVRNDGNAASAATMLRYYQSPDPAITESDTAVGTAAVAGLSAARTLSESVQLTAPSAPGTYYYGACVDAVAGEPDTANNCSASVRVDVPGPGPEPEPEPEPSNPDLVVGLPSVSNSGPAAEASFTLSATVRNGGDGASAATTLRFYRSTDRAITATDMQVGTAAVAGLSASGSRGVSVDLTAPSTPGTYYYGACVDAVAEESDTTNNCSASMEVNVLETLEQPQGSPDLTVGSPTVSNSGPAAGETFTLSATVSNAGDGESATTTLRYYQSTDGTITTSDTAVGTAAVAVLGASGSSSVSVDLTAPSSPGTYYYGACVDAVADESDTTNNCSGSVQVDVPEPPPPSSPDLVVASPSVSDSGPAAGASFTLSATVRNDGDGDATATTLRYYRSTDATISASDTEVGTDAAEALAASGTSAESIDVTAPATAGAYYYGACVDEVTDESDATNNCSSAVSVTVVVQETQPDLTVTLSITPPSGGIFHVGSSFRFGATVRNAGDGASTATTLRYYQSKDAPIRTPDTEIGTDAVGALAAPGVSAESISLTAPSTAGTYYYNACVDAVAGESNTTNNCSFVSIAVTVVPEADLVVGSPSVTDSSPETGDSFTLSATVGNDGDGAAAATTLRYYRSTDGTITTSDTEEGTDAMRGLSAGATSPESISLTAPSSAGTYYYGACVDAVTGESDTTNNCSSAVKVDVAAAPPQPASVKVTAPKAWAPVGDTVTYSARVLDDQGMEMVGAPVSWSTGHSSVATVNAQGVVAAVEEGTTTVTATAGFAAQSLRPAATDSMTSVSGSAQMEVVQRASRVELEPSSLSFDEVGDTATLTATVYDASDNEMQATRWSWSSEDRTVATATLLSRGLSASVQAIGEGTTTVTVHVNGSATGSATVTVTLPSARVDISPASLTFEALGDTKSVTVQVLDENGDEDEDATFGYIGTFSPCCDPFLADPPRGIAITQVDGGLEITAEGPGRGQYTIRSEGVESAILLLTVNQKPASLEVSPSSVSLAVDGTATLRATVKDANDNAIRVDEGDGEGGLYVYWSTSDENVATVEAASGSATATVTAVAAGTATITGRYGASRPVTGTATITVE